MELRVPEDAAAVARGAAREVGALARAAVAPRGRFVMAVSGGQTPWRMLRALAGEHMPCESVHVVQVDERLAPAGDPDRTGIYLKRRRMTLTYPIRNRSRRLLWLVTGAGKGEMLRRLRLVDVSIPAGRVHQGQALLLADRAAAGDVLWPCRVLAKEAS